VTDVFLGVIAISVLAMAVGQIAAVVLATRAVRDAGERLGRLEETVRPIMANVQQISANVHRISEDAVRATAIATAQVERAERLMDDVTRRVDETMNAVQDTVLGPARTGWAVFQGLREAFGAFFNRGPRPSRPRAHGPSPAAAEDDASFIG